MHACVSKRASKSQPQAWHSSFMRSVHHHDCQLCTAREGDSRTCYLFCMGAVWLQMYKGGLDSRQARQLQTWARSLQQRITGSQQQQQQQPGGRHPQRLLPPSPSVQGAAAPAAARGEQGTGGADEADVDSALDQSMLPRQRMEPTSMSSMDEGDEDTAIARALFSHIDRQVCR